MRKSISHLLNALIFNIFLGLAVLGTILEMVIKINFNDFIGKIQHSLTMLHIANGFVKAGKHKAP